MLHEDNTMKLIVHPQNCSGCRVCEVVCTFHHNKVFGRKTSSVEVNRMERKGEFEIIIHQNKENLHQACDFCKNEETPLCVKFCPTGAIILKEND